MAFADLIEAETDELALLESLDAGKPTTDCRNFDFPDVVHTIRWYAEAADKVFGKVSPTGPDNLGLIVREPVGVVGAVLPWNFPAAMLAWKIAPALAAGNSLVVKPPELASLTTLRIAELATQSGVPAGVFNVVPGLGHRAGRAVGLHADIDAVTFTGSAEIGRQFLRYAADSNLKDIVLECGGKNPQLVMGDCADRIDLVASDLAEAAFWNAGQNCSAGSRILVHNSIKGELVQALAEQAGTRTVGDPSNESTTMGPLIEADTLDRVLGYIDGAIARPQVLGTLRDLLIEADPRPRRAVALVRRIAGDPQGGLHPPDRHEAVARLHNNSLLAGRGHGPRGAHPDSLSEIGARTVPPGPVRLAVAWLSAPDRCRSLAGEARRQVSALAHQATGWRRQNHQATGWRRQNMEI
jgi:acyl-CoA reductase-like NAD-dependent aldehyde dehydrogenase